MKVVREHYLRDDIYVGCEPPKGWVEVTDVADYPTTTDTDVVDDSDTDAPPDTAPPQDTPEPDTGVADKLQASDTASSTIRLVWAEGGQQKKMEAALEVSEFDYPALVVLSEKKLMAMKMMSACSPASPRASRNGKISDSTTSTFSGRCFCANFARHASRSHDTTFLQCCDKTAALTPVSVPRSKATAPFFRPARKSSVCALCTSSAQFASMPAGNGFSVRVASSTAPTLFPSGVE